MVKRSKPVTAVNAADITKSWGKVWQKLCTLNASLGAYCKYSVPPSGLEKLRRVVKDYEELETVSIEHQKVLDTILTETKTVDKATVDYPWDSENFLNAWKEWKDYLVEQHGLVLSTRAEKKQLKYLKEYSGDNETAAIEILDYAESRLYIMFFKIDEKPKKNKKGPKTISDGEY